ncbi:hypothetical protein [Gordonia humi]|uniref:Uncharacterized protein n=1 Tax=Gordonia humi TaxID=686429 RepID=A0A840F2F1_9ACTN|nr:hypothetical protein [Gordonia humi]MBB4136613.1 hypothetical protein [Gordonia humi]
MIATILLGVSVLAAALGAWRRSRMAADPAVSDRSVLVADATTAIGIVVLLVPAAVLAWRADPLTGGEYATAAVLAVAVAAFTGSSVVRLVLTAGGIPTRADNHDDPGDGETPLRGGRIIGVLERASVAACLLLAWPAGLAVILAVKSLARFSELRAPRASEQFILGTFASVMWACAVAGIGWLLGV